MTDELRQLRRDYRALRAPASVDETVRRRQWTRRSRPLRRLALAAGVLLPVIALILLAPAPDPDKVADNLLQRPRVTLSLPSPASVAVSRPKVDTDIRRAPRFSTLRTPQRPIPQKSNKEQKDVQT